MSDEPMEKEPRSWLSLIQNLPRGASTLGYIGICYSLGILLGRETFFSVVFPILFLSVMGIGILVELFPLFKRSRFRFGLRSMFCTTSMIALYAAAIGTFSFTSVLGARIVGYLFIGHFLGSCQLPVYLRFATALRYPIELGDQREGEPVPLVLGNWSWPSHLAIAIVFSGSVLLVKGIISVPIDGDYFFVGLGFIGRSHSDAFKRTRVDLYGNGIAILGRFWPWEPEPLGLHAHDGVTRIGPDWLSKEPAWKQRLWPVIPEDKIEEIGQLLDGKYEALSREG